MTNFDDQTVSFADYIDDEKRGDGLVLIQWRQGDPRAQTGGYFFLGSKNTPDGFAPEGSIWTEHEEYFEERRVREAGWKATNLPLMIICARSQPFRRADPNTGRPKEWLKEWDRERPRECGMHADVLVVADGLQALGPVRWSTNASTVAFAIISGLDAERAPRGGILHRVRNEVLDAADRASKAMQTRKAKKLYWLFWITITSQVNAKGTVVFTETRGKAVTLPVPVIPVEVDTKWLTKAYVGSELAAYGEQVRADYDEWRSMRFTNDQTTTATVAGKNTPELVEEENIPF